MQWTENDGISDAQYPQPQGLAATRGSLQAHSHRAGNMPHSSDVLDTPATVQLGGQQGWHPTRARFPLVDIF